MMAVYLAIKAAFKSSIYVRVAAAALAAFMGFKVWLYAHDWKVEDRTVKKVTEQVAKETTAAVTKAEQARARVYRDPAAAQRLRAKYGQD